MAADEAPPVARPPFAFAGSIQPTELSWAYRGGLLVVAIAMLLLPLIYLGVIVLAAAGVWWHLTAHAWWMQGGSTGVQWRATAYVAPAVAGAVVTFFMIKPVFARRPPLADPLTVTASQHPALFAFITEICRHVRAPVPRVVQVDCQVNASAGFAPGLRSVFQRDLVLTIGLPLVRALSVRELGGVLAHEFGHFAQGSGLMLTMLVRGINRWFSRVVYERDNWDARLEQWSQKRRDRLSLLIMPSRAAVWFSRRILTLLMVGGHVISCFMARQMEYDADSYEVKIAGSDAFARTMRRIGELGQAVADSAPHIQRERAKGQLPADLPLFLLTWQRTRLPATAEPVHTAKDSSLFDTHPSDHDRLAAAARADDRGILVNGNESATGLFQNFDWLSRHATRHHYEERGVLDEVRLVDAADSVQASVAREERKQALHAIFDLGVSRYRGLTLAWPSATSSPTLAVQASLQADAIERYNDLVRQRTLAFVAQQLLHVNHGVAEPASFGLSVWTLDAAAAKERECVAQMGVLDSAMVPYERARLERIARGLDRLAASGDEKYGAAHLAVLARTLNEAAAALDIGVGVARLCSARDALTDELIQSCKQPEVARMRRDALTRRIDEDVMGIKQALTDTSTAGLEPGRVVAAAELQYSRLLHELCWLAKRGEGVDAATSAAV